MRQTWRWFGAGDPVGLDDIRQAGATDVVSALYDIPAGEPWTSDAIKAHQMEIESGPIGRTPLRWTIVESVPVHEHIKQGRKGADRYVAAFVESLRNLAACGIRTVVYNFMPVVDATRTDLAYRLPSGATALRFDQDQLAAFDLFILGRPNRGGEYSSVEVERAEATYRAMSAVQKETLSRNIMEGIPGRMTASYRMAEFRNALAEYEGIDRAALQQNLYRFLGQVLPEAEKLGVRLAIHPDDPPRDIFGLPRIVCTAGDLDQLFTTLPSPANGLTLCAGTFGSRWDNNLPSMASRFASRIFFSHLRGVKKDAQEPRSFYEADHLDGDVDLIAVVRALLAEEKRRKANERYGLHWEISIRPDHGHQMLDDLNRTVKPGYSAIGRLKGLAEIRGIIRTLQHDAQHLSGVPPP